MTADGDLPGGARVPLEAGLWAVAGVVLLALVLLAALRPALRRRRKEPTVPCCDPGSLGQHPLGAPDEAGVRRCYCGIVTSIPAGASATVGGTVFTVADDHSGVPIEVRRPLTLVPPVRTDTRELEWDSAALARAAGHPSAYPGDEARTERLRLVRPPR